MTKTRQAKIESIIRKLRNCPELWVEETEPIIRAKIDRAKSLLSEDWKKQSKEGTNRKLERKYEIGAM